MPLSEIDDNIITAHWENRPINSKHYAPTVGRLIQRSTLLSAQTILDHAAAAPAVAGFGALLKRITAQQGRTQLCHRDRATARPEPPAKQTRIKIN